MSDLVGGGPYASPNNGQAGSNGNLSRPIVPPQTTGSPSGVRGPRDIMRERQAREARKKEQQEKETMERARAEQEARLLEEEKRRSAERRANATAGAGNVNPQRGNGDPNVRVSGGSAGQRISDNSQRSERRSGDPNQPLQGVGRGGGAVGGGATGGSRPRPSQSQHRPEQGESSRVRPTTQAQEVPGAQAQPQDQTGQTTGNRAEYARIDNGQAVPVPGSTSTDQPAQGTNTATRSSFPHAFERWETLSAHWEGLTSFWIRRLEENSREISRDPLSAQLSRQVTDLSAAGANLFHAVVELQRLRASSERKFQRWFFETRAEQERFQEMIAGHSRSLEDERQRRVNDIHQAETAQAKVIVLEKELAEKKRELQISKEEARRAWEELGRREQEERERTISLRDGQPTMLGGVQVVPMMQGVPSRHESTRDRPTTRDGGDGGQTSQHTEAPVDNSDIAYQQYSRSQRADPTDPFVDTRPIVASPEIQGAPSVTSSGGGYSQAPAVQPASTSAFYQQAGTTLHPVERDERYGPSGGSDVGLSDEEYEIDDRGNFITDEKGNKIRYRAPASDADTDEYDVTADREREIANLQRYGQVSGADYGVSSTAPSSRPQVATSRPIASEPDYAGQGYGSGPGWEAVPRHHHPTRLSDVLEEDERSRTSASQVSRRD